MNTFPSARGCIVSERRAVLIVVLALVFFPQVARAQIVLGPFSLGGFRSEAHAMNASGQVVGSSQTRHLDFTSPRHAFSWTPTGEMTNLGALWPGATSSNATAVSATGQVVGVVSVGGAELQGFLWTAAGGMTDLGGLPGGHMIPASVNTAGHVVGSSVTLSGASGLPERHAVSWTPEGGIISLGGSALVDTFAVEVNDQGFIVGYSEDRASRVQQALAWIPSDLGYTRIALGTLGGRGSVARHMNVSGQVIGDSYVANESDLHAFSWTLAGGMVDLGTLGGCCGQAFGLNDQGQVVGWSSTSNGAQHAFSWTTTGGMIDLGTLGGCCSYANAVNASGQIVGWSALRGAGGGFGNVHGFLWSASGGLIDLGALPAPVPTDSSAAFINDAGQIAGMGSVPLTFVIRLPVAVVWRIVDIATDTTPPSVACSAEPAVLGPPNNKLVAVKVNVQVTDDLSGAAGFNLVAASTNEGDAALDIVDFAAGTADTAGEFRASRDGGGNGRVYELTYEARDVAGNTAACTTTVTVPHDRRR